jgi:hypothetical protein
MTPATRRLIAIAASVCCCLGMLPWSASAYAASDPCTALTLEEISQGLGDTFQAPIRTFAPGGKYKGDYVSCNYTGKTLTFEIKQWQFPWPELRDRNLRTVEARYRANAQSSPLPDLGADAWWVNDLVDRIDGPYETYLAVYPTASEAYQVNRRDKLVALAKLYFSRP